MFRQFNTSLPYALAAGAGIPMAWFGPTITLKASGPRVLYLKFA
jgi:hypothetical protein